MALAESAATVQLSIPPDNPRTTPSELVFSKYSLMKRVICVSTFRRSMSRTEDVSSKLVPLHGFMILSRVFKDKHKILGCRCHCGIEGFEEWDEGEGKLFEFPRSTYPSSSLVLNVARRQSVLKSFVMKTVLW
jgi:hypothetical protein